MGGGSAPPPPDPYAIANAQFGQNQKTANYEAALNRFTQRNPFGTVSWQNSGTTDNPQWSQTTTLSPAQQGIYDTQLGTQQNLADQANQYTGQLQQALANPIQGSSRNIQDAYNSILAANQPNQDQQRQQLETRLANQGLAPGGEAYDNAERQFNQGVNNFDVQAYNQATNIGSQRQQQDIAAQNQALNIQNQLNQGSGNVNVPTYSGSTSVSAGSPVDIATLINQQYQNQLANYNQKQASKNGIMGQAGNFGSAVGELIPSLIG